VVTENEYAEYAGYIVMSLLEDLLEQQQQQRWNI
jgi:hypothetical protein